MEPSALDPNKRVIDLANDFQGLCATIGFVAQNWAMLEQSFDAWIALIYHNLGGRTVVNPALPLSFKKKMRFLRAAFRSIGPLKQFEGKAIPIIDKALNIAKWRNDLIHGAVSSMVPVNDVWSFTIIDTETPKDKVHWHKIREFKYGVGEFQAIESKLVPLVRDAASLGKEILRLERP